MKQIPDYDGYFVKKDGQVFSKKNNKFLKPRDNGERLSVILSSEGMGFTKIVSRLVFETYNGETSKCIYHTDGNYRNNSLDNLEAIDWSELGKRNAKKSTRKPRVLNRVNIETGQHDRVALSFVGETAKEADAAKKCISLRNSTAHGNMYFLDGQKKRLEDSLRKKIKINQELVYFRDARAKMQSPKPFQKNIERTLELLRILEGVNDICG